MTPALETHMDGNETSGEERNRFLFFSFLFGLRSVGLVVAVSFYCSCVYVGLLR